MARRLDRSLYELSDAEVELLWNLLKDHIDVRARLNGKMPDEAVALARKILPCMPAKRRKRVQETIEDCERYVAWWNSVPHY